MSLRIGKKCEWDDIEIGEVYIEEGCVQILCKIGRKKSILLADDWSNYPFIGPGDNWYNEGYPFQINFSTFYKLSKSVQAFWRIK